MAIPGKAQASGNAHVEALMTRHYAVVWSAGAAAVSGRLEVRADRFELCGRNERRSIRFAELASATIARGRADRLRGLPILLLRPRDVPPIRVASLEGAGVLHELMQHVQRAGLSGVGGGERDVRDEGRPRTGGGLDCERAAEEREPLAHADEAKRIFPHLVD